MDSLLLILLLIPFVGALVSAFLPEGPFVKYWGLGTCLTALAVVLVMTPSFTFDQRPDADAAALRAEVAKVRAEQAQAVAAAPAAERQATSYRYAVELKPLNDQLAAINSAGDRTENTVQLRYAPKAFAVSQLGFGLRLGMDTISYWLVLLTVFLMPLAVAASFGSIKERQKEYYGWMLALLACMLGVFIARDVLLFYVFFELTLIPMFFIIGVWGGPEKRRASTKFFLFTFAGSVFLLAGVIYLGLSNANRADAFSFPTVIAYAQSLPAGTRFWVFLALLAGFAVKVPLFPVHTWLPLAHTEAPTAGSVILAGVLLKLGTYGILRLALPVGLVGVEGALATTMQVVAVLCIVGIIYAALIAWVQRDIKKLVAYSSVSHLGFCVLGLVALNTIGIQGSVFYMINHGLSTGAMFLVIGMIYDRYHTRDIDALSGLAKRMPVMACFFILFVMSSIGLPGTNGFVSEFLTILGAFTSGHLGFWYGVTAATGVVLGAIYMLHMTARVILGPLKTPALHADGHGAAHGGLHNTTTRNTHDPESLTPGANADIAADAPDKPYQPEDADRRADDAVVGHVSPAQTRGGQGVTHADEPGDLTWREIGILVPLAIAVILLGVLPTPLLNSIRLPVQLVQTPAMTEATQVATVPDAKPVAAVARAD